MVQHLLDHKIEQLAVQIKQMTAFQFELEEYRDRWTEVPKARPDDREICPLIATVSLQTDVA